MNLMIFKFRASSSSSSTINLYLNPHNHLQCLQRSTTIITGSTARFHSSRVPTSPSSDPGTTAPSHSGPYRTVSGSSRREVAPRSAGNPTRSHAAARAATPAVVARASTLALRAPPCTATRLLVVVRHTRRRTRSSRRRLEATRSQSTSIALSYSAARVAIRSTIATSTPRWSSPRPLLRRSTRRLIHQQLRQ